MSELFGLSPAPLPLLLWKTPPGLELILAQEGVAFEVVGEAHPFAFRGARFVLFDGRRESPGRVRSLLTSEHVAIDVDALRAGEPADPFETLIDDASAVGVWEIDGWTLRERVARYPKAWIRRRLIAALRDEVLARGGVWMRLAPYPYPYRSAFNLRVDLDENEPEDYRRFARLADDLADCLTCFVNTSAYRDQPKAIADLRSRDAQSHGHFHHVYRDGAANLKNLRRADRVLRDLGFAVEGFAAPHGRWNAGLDDALESLGYRYSSDFQLGYDDLPFFPWRGGRFSRVLQVPVHPICEGLFLDAGAAGGHSAAGHLARVVEAKIAAGEPAFVYGHPERRLGRMPEVFRALEGVLKSRPFVWRTTLTEMARWWRWRAERAWRVVPRDGGRLEVQFDEWSAAYPLAVEVQRGEFSCSLPIAGSRTVLAPRDLVYEKRPALDDRVVRPPAADRAAPSLKRLVREAIDWELATPIDEIAGRSLADRLKKGLRRWKHERTGAR